MFLDERPWIYVWAPVYKHFVAKVLKPSMARIGSLFTADFTSQVTRDNERLEERLSNLTAKVNALDSCVNDLPGGLEKLVLSLISVKQYRERIEPAYDHRHKLETERFGEFSEVVATAIDRLAADQGIQFAAAITSESVKLRGEQERTRLELLDSLGRIQDQTSKQWAALEMLLLAFMTDRSPRNQLSVHAGLNRHSETGVGLRTRPATVAGEGD